MNTNYLEEKINRTTVRKEMAVSVEVLGHKYTLAHSEVPLG